MRAPVYDIRSPQKAVLPLAAVERVAPPPPLLNVPRGPDEVRGGCGVGDRDVKAGWLFVLVSCRGVENMRSRPSVRPSVRRWSSPSRRSRSGERGRYAAFCSPPPPPRTYGGSLCWRAVAFFIFDSSKCIRRCGTGLFWKQPSVVGDFYDTALNTAVLRFLEFILTAIVNLK